MDPGEIVREYRTTRFADRFYNLKIGIPWADLERRLDAATVLALCTDRPMADCAAGDTVMGVDTGRDLHVVILKDDAEDDQKSHLIHVAVCGEFRELDVLMERFRISRCVIDGLPETHATRDFAQRHAGRVYMNFFNENQRGKPHFDHAQHLVQVNRTEALDASRSAVREGRVTLPSRDGLVETFALHMAADAKILDEDEETGARKYRYIRTGPDHFSLAFTYAWLAASDTSGARAWARYIQRNGIWLR